MFSFFPPMILHYLYTHVLDKQDYKTLSKVL